jgi:hypothetical protein
MYLPATMIQPQPEQVVSRTLLLTGAGTLSDRQSACAGAGINPRVPTTMSPTMNSRLIFIRPPFPSALNRYKSGPDDIGSQAERGCHWSSPGAIIGRSSITSPGAAKRAAISSARSREAQSMTKNPARCSFDSAYGPSVATCPFWSQR